MHYIHLTQALPGVPSGLSKMLHVIIVTKVTVIVFKSAKRKKIDPQASAQCLQALSTQDFPFLGHFTSQFYLIKTFTYDPVFLPNVRKFRHHFSVGQCEHLSNLPLAVGCGVLSRVWVKMLPLREGLLDTIFPFLYEQTPAQHQTSIENENADLGKTWIHIWE